MCIVQHHLCIMLVARFFVRSATSRAQFGHGESMHLIFPALFCVIKRLEE